MRLLIFLFTFTLSIHLTGQVNFHQGDYASALEQARMEKKPLLLDAYTVWCGPCKALDKNVFQDPEAAEFINNNFVSYKLDMEKGEGPLVAMKFRISSYPITLFISPEGKLIDKKPGYPGGKEGYLEWCGEILEKKEDVFSNIDARNMETAFPEFYQKSFTSDQWKREKVAVETINEYLSKQQDLTSEVNWSVAYRFSYLNHDYMDELVTHFEDLQSLYPETELQNFQMTYAYALLGDYKAIPDEDVESKVSEVVEIAGAADDFEFKSNLLFNIYYSRKAWKQLLNLLTHPEQESYPFYINQVCWQIYTLCDDQTLITRAIEVMHSVDMDEADPNYIDTLAHLYYKSGNAKNAKLYAEMALQKGEGEQLPMKETKELLEKLNGNG